MVVIFLESAELRVKNRLDITVSFWKENVDRILEFNDQKILTGPGAISHAQMEKRVDAVYEKFEEKRKSEEAIEADKQDLEELKELESQLKKRKDDRNGE